MADVFSTLQSFLGGGGGSQQKPQSNPFEEAFSAFTNPGEGSVAGLLKNILGGGQQQRVGADPVPGVPAPMPTAPRTFAPASDPVSSYLPPTARALLNAIAMPESRGEYDIRYTPKGGAKFNADLGEHPGIFEPGPEGRSSAAGRYMFTKTTWDKMGGGKFTPEQQDLRALQLANMVYSQQTKGRDLMQDLETEGLTPRILKTLSSTWTGLRDNPGSAMRAYSDSVTRYSTPLPAQAGGSRPLLSDLGQGEVLDMSAMKRVPRLAERSSPESMALRGATIPGDLSPEPNNFRENAETGWITPYTNRVKKFSQSVADLQDRMDNHNNLPMTFLPGPKEKSPQERIDRGHKAVEQADTYNSFNANRRKGPLDDWTGENHGTWTDNTNTHADREIVDPSLLMQRRGEYGKQELYTTPKRFEKDAESFHPETRNLMRMKAEAPEEYQGIVNSTADAFIQLIGQVVPIPIQPGPHQGPPRGDAWQRAVEQSKSPGSNVRLTPRELDIQNYQNLSKRLRSQD